MKISIRSTCTLPLLLCGCAGPLERLAAVAPADEFAGPAVLTTVEGVPLASDGWGVPVAADIDGDGRVDLVVGQFMNHQAPWPRRSDEYDTMSAGTVRWYRNVGEPGEPRYSPGVDLRAGDGLLSAPNW